MKVLLTSSSFKETPGPHQDLLNKYFKEVDYHKGPLAEKDILAILPGYDALLCGDDELTETVLKTAHEKGLKVISKYGVGLDKINLVSAKQLGLRVTSCPGVNATSVAEHVFALLLAHYKNIVTGVNATRSGQWKRLTGNEILSKKIAILGCGAIGARTAQLAVAFGMKVTCFDLPNRNPNIPGATFTSDIDDCLAASEIVSIHLPLNSETRGILNSSRFKTLAATRPVIVNTARAGVVDQSALLAALENQKISGYLADVLETEPMEPTEPLHKFPNVLITAHVGSRTFESVARQGTFAVENLIKSCKEVGFL